MRIRISYYVNSEIENGRAPRHVIDVEADTVLEGVNKLKTSTEGFVLRSAYRAPVDEIKKTAGYIYLTPAHRKRWYKQANNTPRDCAKCSNPAPPRRRVCDSCRSELEKKPDKFCSKCKVKKIPSRLRVCQACRRSSKKVVSALRRKQARAEQRIKALATLIDKAKRELRTSKSEACINASFYQGLRYPKCFYGNPCRSCLSTWINVQSEYRKKLLAGTVEPLRSAHPRERVKLKEVKITMENYKTFSRRKRVKGAKA
jgi:hypothetical protein